MKDSIQQWLLKVLKMLCVVALTLSLMAELLRNVTATQLMLAVALVSPIAYYIRKSRGGSARRSPRTSAGERSPVMPRTDV